MAVVAHGPSPALQAFAAEVGGEEAGPVVAVGGRTQWDVGGPPDPAAREVRAPAGIVELEPAEMVVRCGAGTPVADLDRALAERGQMVPLDPLVAPGPGRPTVGGVLAVGRSGLRRLRYGPLRDALLEARFVTAAGRLVKTGAPVVKNVTGYDMGRLLVGSLGTLGLLAEVVLRAQPLPAVSQWLVGGGDPFQARRRLFRPSSILWDGARVWVLLEGHAADVDAEAAALGPGFAAAAGPPDVPTGGRRSLRPSELRGLASAFVAEVGVGTVHLAPAGPPPPPPPSAGSAGSAGLQRRLKEAFDPTGRLNPGRVVP